LKVSVITVIFNSSEKIENTIESVLRQNYNDIEYIVIDSGSTDGTLEILARYQGKIAKCISEPDKSVYDAMNKGIRLSTGDIAATLNSDDVYADETIVAQMVEFMRSNQLDTAYGDLLYIASAGSDCVTRFSGSRPVQEGRLFHD
jgi:glycosyltransferase involved in cell wall biosynthesis